MQMLLLSLITFACLILTPAWSENARSHNSNAKVANSYIRPAEYYRCGHSLNAPGLRRIKGGSERLRTPGLRTPGAGADLIRSFPLSRSPRRAPLAKRVNKVQEPRVWNGPVIAGNTKVLDRGGQSKNTSIKVKTDKDAWQKTTVQASLPEIARRTLKRHFGLDDQSLQQNSISGRDDAGVEGADLVRSAPAPGVLNRSSPPLLDDFANSFAVPDNFKTNAGLFVTLEKNGKTRACWGSISSNYKDLVKATVFTTEDALHKDYRYTPITKDEINQLILQITVIKRIVPISSIRSMHPLKEGLMVRSGGKGAVLLPGEASDPHYQLVKCKLKAGIPSNQPCQLYKIEADVYR